MTLGFSQQINGKPNFFIQKIWMSLPSERKRVYYEYFYDCHVYQIGRPWDIVDHKIQPKTHTIRQDTYDRWKAGKLIHPVINNRTANRFQFAPAFPCISTQKIEIKWSCYFDKESRQASVFVDRNYIGSYDEKKGQTILITRHASIETLALNDGFENVKDFFAYFNQDFEGKIIHWTDLKY